MNHFAFVIGITAVAAGFGMSGEVSAVTITRNYFSHGTANCQAALPVFDTPLRKRPQGVANQGTSTAFITCDTESIKRTSPDGASNGVTVTFVNRGASSNTVSCTLVNGSINNFMVSTTYFPKTSGNVQPNFISTIQWTPADNGGANFLAPAISCALPPQLEIGSIEFNLEEGVYN